MRTPIAITAIALTALLASAATVGAERLITGADIKDGSITARDIKAGSLTGDRLHPASRDRVFISKSKRGRQLQEISGDGTTVATLKVPAGSYAIQAMLVLSNGNSSSTNALCELDDGGGTLGGSPYYQQWMTKASGEVLPMTIVGVATYAAPATIAIVCYASMGTVETTGGTLLAEQVTVADAT